MQEELKEQSLYNLRLKDVKYAGDLGLMAAPPSVALRDSEFYENLL